MKQLHTPLPLVAFALSMVNAYAQLQTYGALLASARFSRAQTGPIGIISVLIVSAITLLIGAMVLGQVDNTINCNSITNANGTAACKQTKNITWDVYKIIPITLLFLILGIFGIGRLRG